MKGRGVTAPRCPQEGVASMLFGGLQRRRRPACVQVQQEAKESCDVLLLITWSPRPSACCCALDYCEHQQHLVVAFFRFDGLKERGNVRRFCPVVDSDRVTESQTNNEVMSNFSLNQSAKINLVFTLLLTI